MVNFEIAQKYVGKVMVQMMNNEVIRATKYITPHFVVTATRRRYKKRVDKRGNRADIWVKVGAPNYAERQFIKQLRRAKVTFPVRKIQLKYQEK